MNHKLAGTRAQIAHGDLAGAEATLAGLRLDLASMTDLTTGERSAIEARIAALEAAIGRANGQTAAHDQQPKSGTKASHTAVPNNTKAHAAQQHQDARAAEHQDARADRDQDARAEQHQDAGTGEHRRSGIRGHPHGRAPEHPDREAHRPRGGGGSGAGGGGATATSATATDAASKAGKTAQGKGATR